jgi:tRNA(Ile)-lysidine synthase
MIENFKRNIEKNHLFSSQDKLLLALSGGSDSVALFHALRLSEYPFSAAHMNYNLRGEEARKDQEFVEDLCKTYNVHLDVKVIPAAHWEKVKGSVQLEARKLRYAFFNELAEKNKSFILTAHHLDDQLESVLMNFTRGTGIRGLTGIPPRNKNIVRPLLSFPKKELHDFLQSKNYEWREDSSNQKDLYTRNRYRNTLVPVLLKENPNLYAGFKGFLKRMQLLEKNHERLVEEYKHKYMHKYEDGWQILLENSEDTACLLFDVLEPFGINSNQIERILSTRTSGKNWITATHRIMYDRKRLFVHPLKADIPKSSFEIDSSAAFMQKPFPLEISYSNNLEINSDPAIAQFDASKLKFPLKIRPWQKGDRMIPLGMPGSKKISDILIDLKVPLHFKSEVWVLLSNEEILWLVGYKQSEQCKISEATKDVLSIRLAQNHE